MTSLKDPLLSGLGRNPAAPEDVLVRLAAHGAGRHGMSMRRGPLADAVAEALLTHGGSDSAVGLHGGRVSPAMRRRIAEHPDPAIRDAFAEFVRHTVDRGVPLGIDGLEEAYGKPRTELVRAPDPELRAAVARAWYERPESVQSALLTDPDPQVRAAAGAGERPGIPRQLWDRCIADPAVRESAARHVPLTPDQFAQLWGTDDEEVQRAVAANPHLTADMVARLLDIEDPLVRVAVAQSRHVEAETRDRLFAMVEAERADGSIDAELALTWPFSEPHWLRDAPLDERLTYLDCPHHRFRRVLASCHDLPEEAWQRLDNDPDVQVRRIAARRPDVPPEVLERLIRAHGEVFHVSPLLVEHPNFPRQALRTFVDEPDPRIRYVALQDPDLPVPALHRLATDEEDFLRRGAARHPNITHELLERLLVDRDPHVVDDAAANSVLSPARMRRILAEADL